MKVMQAGAERMGDAVRQSITGALAPGADPGLLLEALAGVEALTKACQDPVTREGLIGAGKESGELEADAGLLMAITTDPGTTSASRPAVCAVLKNRAGGTGTVPMVFMPIITVHCMHLLVPA